MKKYLILFLSICILPVFILTHLAASETSTLYLILVNRDNKLPDDWTEHVSFEVGKNSLGELYIIEQQALRDFNLLRAKLNETENFKIELDSVYRSLGEQQDIWDFWSADPEKGPEYCKQYLAPVGCSEHHTGLAIDIFLIRNNGEILRENEEMLADKEDFAKIHQIIANFGFILRYPEGKESITGYSYKPWHLRYVGSPKIAKEIMEKGITLEEYLTTKA